MTCRSTRCLLALAAAALSLAGWATPAVCATPVAFDYTAFHQHPPRSILVLPPLNQSTSIEGPYSWLSTVSRPLAERGYYVFPVAVVDQLMKENGLPTAAEMHEVPPARLGEITGADAVLYVVLHKYGSKYQLIDTTASVEVSARLVDTKSGAVLWNGWGRADKSTSDSSGKFFSVDLLGALIDQVINSKTDPGHKLSRQANEYLFGTRKREIPAGPYQSAAKK